MILKKLVDLVPDKDNANKGTQRGLKALDTSLRQYGAGRSILVDKHGRIIAGNKTVERAADIGLDDVIVVESDGTKLVAVKRTDLDLDSEDGKARALATYDNRVGQLDLDWDIDALKSVDSDVLKELWNVDELDKMGVMAKPEGDAEPQIYRAAELQEKWQVKTGDLWRIGEHRLLCGDSTKRDDVEKVMGGEKAQLVWTDPPYGVNYGEKLEDANPIAHRVRMIENDDLPPDKLEEFLRTCLINACEVCDDGAVIYVASPAGTLLPALIASFTGSGFTYHWGLIWLKDQIVLSRADYHFKHENILYGWKHGAAHYFTDDRTQPSVFEYPRPKASDEYPTMKPIELIQHMIRNSSKVGWLVLDIFGGSGSTMLACENARRKCRMVELADKYCAVTLERMATAFPGIEIERVSSDTGK